MALAVTTLKINEGFILTTYDNLDTLDTAPDPIAVGSDFVMSSGSGLVHGTIQAVGTFGSGTVKLQMSNDGTNWVDMKDINNTAIGITAAGASEFNTAARYIRPLITGGTGDDVDVFITTRS